MTVRLWRCLAVCCPALLHTLCCKSRGCHAFWPADTAPHASWKQQGTPCSVIMQRLHPMEQPTHADEPTYQTLQQHPRCKPDSMPRAVLEQLLHSCLPTWTLMLPNYSLQHGKNCWHGFRVLRSDHYPSCRWIHADHDQAQKAQGKLAADLHLKCPQGSVPMRSSGLDSSQSLAPPWLCIDTDTQRALDLGQVQDDDRASHPWQGWRPAQA